MNFETITVYLKGNRLPIIFTGRPVHKLWTNTWEYYEMKDGIVRHFRKDKIVLLIGFKEEHKPDNCIRYRIHLEGDTSSLNFLGVYRRDLETELHHFYQANDGSLFRFLKTTMMAVAGDTIESILNNREK